MKRFPQKEATTRLAYRVPEVAEMLGMSVRKVNELIATGKLESTKIDRCRRITPEQIAGLLGVRS